MITGLYGRPEAVSSRYKYESPATTTDETQKQFVVLELSKNSKTRLITNIHYKLNQLYDSYDEVIEGQQNTVSNVSETSWTGSRSRRPVQVTTSV